MYMYNVHIHVHVHLVLINNTVLLLTLADTNTTLSQATCKTQATTYMYMYMYTLLKTQFKTKIKQLKCKQRNNVTVNCLFVMLHVTCTLFRKYSLLAKHNLKLTRVALVLITKWPHVCSLSQSILLATVHVLNLLVSR